MAKSRLPFIEKEVKVHIFKPKVFSKVCVCMYRLHTKGEVAQ